MAARTVDQGLQRIADTASQTAGFASARFIRTLSLDDGTVAFAAGHTNLESGGAVTNEYDRAFDGTPTRSGLIVSHVTTIPAADALFTIKRVALHDDTVANVTKTSTTLVAGIDGQSILKTADFTLAITVTLTYSNV